MLHYLRVFLNSVIFLLALSCGGGGGGSGLTVDNGDTDGEDSSGDAGTGSFEEGAPIDLPAPIAKGLDGIEPTSVQFTPISGQTGVAGTLSAETIGKVDATVAIIRSGEIYARQKTTAGKVEFEIPTELLGEVLALVVLSEDEESVSPPVLVEITQAGSNDPVVDVLLTNTGVIQNQQIALSSDGTVAFSALDSSSEPFIGTVSVNGGSPSVLTSAPDNLIGSLRYRANGDLWGIDTVTGTIYSNGTAVGQGFTVVSAPADAFFSFSPNDEWILYTDEHTGSLRAAAADVDDLIRDLAFSPDASTVASLQFDWLTNDRAVLAKGFSDGTYALQLYDYVNLNTLGTSNADQAQATITTLATGTGTMANPQANRADGDEFAYVCGQAGGTTGLCYYDITANVGHTVDIGPVAHPRLAPDGSYTVYEKDAGSGLSDCSGNINHISSTLLTITTLATGCYPVPHPTNSNLIAYLKPVEEELQVGVINLDNLGL